jgi:predicted exporter
MLHGPNAEAVLQREEAVLPQFQSLIRENAVSSIELAAQTLPSIATQLARRAALPDPAVLAGRLDAARAGTPFRAQAFQPFIDDIAASRSMPPVLPGDITNPLLASRLQSLLFQRDDEWFGIIFPSEVSNSARLAAVVAGLGDAMFVDMGAETNRMVSSYMGNALRWLGYGAAAAALALLVGLRDPVRAARVAASVAAAALVTVAVLAAAGMRLSLIHIVSLQLVGGVGLDYALFFARRQLDEEERARTLRTLVTCNAMTLLTFGLLALCQTPLLRDIGVTVVVGVVAAMVFAFLFAGQHPGARQRA